LARGHARLWVAARGEVLARSRVLQFGQVVSRARAPALEAPLIPGRVFIVARSSHNKLCHPALGRSLVALARRRPRTHVRLGDGEPGAEAAVVALESCSLLRV